MNDQTIFRRAKDRDNPYVMVDKSIFENDALSWQAKGLMGYLLSRPDDWIVRMPDLVKHGLGGMDTIRTTIKELEEHGYLVRRREHDASGLFLWVTEVHEIPIPIQPSTDHPYMDEPYMDEPSMVSPSAVNPTLLSTDLTKIECTKEESPIGDLPGEDIEKTEEPPPRDYLTDVVATYKRTKGKPSWTIPAGAGGADPYLDGPLLAACAILRITPESLAPKEQRSYASVIRTITEGVKDGTPELFIQACQMWAGYGPSWKGKTGPPYSSIRGDGFRDDMQMLMRQITSGTIGKANGWSKDF
jgi:hypothetical protein